MSARALAPVAWERARVPAWAPGWASAWVRAALGVGVDAQLVVTVQGWPLPVTPLLVAGSLP